MKFTLAILVILIPILMGAVCDRATPLPADKNHNTIDENTESMIDTLIIKVESKEFTATLLNNRSAAAFKAMLPLTMSMTELNGNEKFFELPQNLPTNASNAGMIKSGDLMLWGSNTLVLFYETFATSYSYTKLGKIDNPAGLAAAVGSGNVTVTIELQ
jgi:hypothetical protein